MNIFRRALSGALLLLAINVQSAHAMNSFGNREELEEFIKQTVKKAVKEVLENHQQQGSTNLPSADDLMAGLSVEKLMNSDLVEKNEEPNKNKKRKLDDENVQQDEQQPTKKQKLNESQSDMVLEQVAQIDLKNIDVVNAKDENGMTILHRAARDGNISLINQIIGNFKGTDLRDMVQKRDKNGKVPLYYAAQNGHVGAITPLTNEYPIDLVDCLAYAFNNNHFGFVNYLHDKLMRDRSHGIPAFSGYLMKYKAVCDKNITALELIYSLCLQDEKEYLSYTGEWDLLYKAIKDDAINVVRFILGKTKSGLSAHEFEKLMSRKGGDDKNRAFYDTTFLSEHDAAESTNKTLISHAKECGNGEIVALLLGAGATESASTEPSGKKDPSSCIIS